tara:strand:+ start:4933 stop:5373 length:441 start_codon:yes stop_codon:yes gene_type:complete
MFKHQKYLSYIEANSIAVQSLKNRSFDHENLISALNIDKNDTPYTFSTQITTGLLSLFIFCIFGAFIILSYSWQIYLMGHITELLITYLGIKNYIFSELIISIPKIIPAIELFLSMIISYALAIYIPINNAIYYKNKKIDTEALNY